MKIVSFLASLVLFGVGTWARIQYRSIHDEIHGTQPIEYGTLDQYFYDEGNAFDGGACDWQTGGAAIQPYQPKAAISSGVQANPFLD